MTYTEEPPSPKVSYFDVVVGLAWSKDPESYADNDVASDRVYHAGQVKRDDPDEKGYPGPLGWGLGVRPTSPRKKVYGEKTSTMSWMRLINKRRYYRS